MFRMNPDALVPTMTGSVLIKPYMTHKNIPLEIRSIRCIDTSVILFVLYAFKSCGINDDNTNTPAMIPIVSAHTISSSVTTH